MEQEYITLTSGIAESPSNFQQFELEMNHICSKLNKILRRNQQYEEIFKRSKILTPLTAKNTDNLAQLLISNIN